MTDNTKENKTGKKISWQEIIIIIMILSYVLIFFAYKHDIDQYTLFFESPESFCREYYNYSNTQVTSTPFNKVGYIHPIKSDT